ncbi:hypothetical protein RDWZM_008140 [Blomia tropicalis]|uniref:RNA exonuclease 4 n=1 Tax=Blomia tropicalis TaxID=40697 RepID=A0A9Q0RIL1_BLOTA|nr:hypothetical protein RDWZM_008140 [Blomia tropicalis]
MSPTKEIRRPRVMGIAIKKKKMKMGKSKNLQVESVNKKKPSNQYPINGTDVSANWQRLQETIRIKTMTQPSYKTNTNSNKGKTKMNMSNTSERRVSNRVNGVNNQPKPDVWFDDVDPCLVKSSMISSNMSEKKLCKENSFDGLTRYIAIDCEMVGTGFDGSNSILARVSMVNLYGHCVYDKYVKPVEEVTDYRTQVSGIRPENLVNGEDFKMVQKEVYDIIQNRILVGHAIQHDLKVLFLSQPKHMIRDTSVYFKKFFNNRTPSLKKLSEVYLGVKIQQGEHDSITDAQATMRLYTLFKKKWETSLSQKMKCSKVKRNQKPEMILPVVT